LRKTAAWLRRWKQRLYSTTEVRIYAQTIFPQSEPSPDNPSIHKNRWEDIECYDENAGWVSRKRFLHVSKARLKDGEDIYTIIEDGRLVHYGWTAQPVSKRYLEEVDTCAEFESNSLYLYDFFTHPEYRNRGLYQRTVSQILAASVDLPHVRSAYIVVTANTPLLAE